jgi:SpoVK/Ycf46/Vps4 family AAA+-type ATPase
MGVLIVNDKEEGEDGKRRTEGSKEEQKINPENLSVAGSCADVTNIISEFSNLSIDKKSKVKNRNDSNKNENNSTGVEEGDHNGRKNEKIPISTSPQVLTTSFVSQIASKAHGMVACDLLQVVKESFYISLCRRNKEGQLGRKQTGEEGMDANLPGDVDSIIVPSSSVVCSPTTTATKTTSTTAAVIATTSAVDDVVESAADHVVESAADDGMYRPTNLISDYEDEEMEEDEGAADENEAEEETLECAPASDYKSHPISTSTNSTTEESLILQHTRIEVSPRPLEEVPGPDPRTDPSTGQKGASDGDMPPAPVPVSCGVLTEEDLQLALTRIAPSALRYIPLSCLITSYHSNILSYLSMTRPHHTSSCLILSYLILPYVTILLLRSPREVAIEVPCVRWADIGGMEGVKRSLREVDPGPRPQIPTDAVGYFHLFLIA